MDETGGNGNKQTEPAWFENPAVRIAAVYLIFGALWILLSDLILAAIVPDHELFARLQTAKGWFFILITAGLLYVLVISHFRSLEASERELKESQARYRSLVETTNDWVWEIDRNAVYTYSSPQVRELLGYAPEEMLGKTPFDFMPPEESDRLKAVFEEITSGLRPFRLLQNENIRKDGRRVVLETSGVPVFDREGNYAGYRGIDRDITDRIAAAKELEATDRKIRHAYVDVIYAVTGGRLIIATPHEIEETLGGRATEDFSIGSFKELSGARTLLKEKLQQEYPKFEDVDDLTIAISEALTNGVKHAGGATFALYKTPGTAQIVVTDAGAGIDFDSIARATLLAGYSTKGSLGMGFSIMLEFCDKLYLSTQPGKTIVVLEKNMESQSEGLGFHYGAI
ncbi:MAG: PAS domain S-box protein [Candidatus Aquicultorales bacterium]